MASYVYLQKEAELFRRVLGSESPADATQGQLELRKISFKGLLSLPLRPFQLQPASVRRPERPYSPYQRQ